MINLKLLLLTELSKYSVVRFVLANFSTVWLHVNSHSMIKPFSLSATLFVLHSCCSCLVENNLFMTVVGWKLYAGSFYKEAQRLHLYWFCFYLEHPPRSEYTPFGLIGCNMSNGTDLNLCCEFDPSSFQLHYSLHCLAFSVLHVQYSSLSLCRTRSKADALPRISFRHNVACSLPTIGCQLVGEPGQTPPPPTVRWYGQLHQQDQHYVEGGCFFFTPATAVTVDVSHSVLLKLPPSLQAGHNFRDVDYSYVQKLCGTMLKGPKLPVMWVLHIVPCLMLVHYTGTVFSAKWT